MEETYDHDETQDQVDNLLDELNELNEIIAANADSNKRPSAIQTTLTSHRTIQSD